MRATLRRLKPRIARVWFWLTRAGFPFHWPARGATPEMARRRRFGRRMLRARWPLWLRPFACLAMTLLWPYGAWREAREEAASAPRPVSAGRLWRIAVRHNLPPREALRYGADLPDAPCADSWICQYEMVRTLPALNTPQATALAWDKAAFARHCLGRDLPAIPTLAEWRGTTRSGLPASAWPGRVVLKPVFSSKGQGVELRQIAGGTARLGETTLALEALEHRGAMLGRRLGAVIVQPALTAHPDLTGAGMAGMPITRLVTGCWPDGAVEVIEAFWVAPAQGRFASNSGGEHVWLVDAEHGTLLPTPECFYGKWAGPEVAGLALPHWAEAIATVRTAHSTFPAPCVALGWDVALTPDGPVLIEANTGISSTLDQTLRGTPAGVGRMGDLVEAWLSQAPR